MNSSSKGLSTESYEVQISSFRKSEKSWTVRYRSTRFYKKLTSAGDYFRILKLIINSIIAVSWMRPKAFSVSKKIPTPQLRRPDCRLLIYRAENHIEINSNGCIYILTLLLEFIMIFKCIFKLVSFSVFFHT